MKMISMLLALLLVGYLAQQQLASTSANSALQDTLSKEGISVPKVPTSLNDVKRFEVDMNKLMQDAADKKAKLIDESLNH